MRSRIKTGEGAEIKPATTGVLQQRKRFDQNYGAMTTVMGYLPRMEQLKLQGLDKWQYDIGVCRVQVRIEWPEMFYFFDEVNHQVLAINETGECQRFDCRGESDFSNVNWKSCQVGRSHLFQCTNGSFRILNIDPSQKSFIVEKSGARLERDVYCLTNFKDQFIFLFGQCPQSRYSLAEDRWEEIPDFKFAQGSACSLGDKVYLFSRTCVCASNLIQVLHNPGASISSQELHWQEIWMPKTIVQRSKGAAFVPLNSTEIAILGGCDRVYGRLLGDVTTLNTSTCEFKKEMEDKNDIFYQNGIQSAKVSENTIIALMMTEYLGQPSLIKYKKGDTCVTNIQM